MGEKKPIKLSEIPKTDVFRTPEGYFEDLQDRIAERIAKPEGKQVFFMRPVVRNISLAAAAVIAILIVALPLMLDKPTPSAEQLIAKLSAEDCLYYLQHSDMETAEILSIVDTDNLFVENEQALPPAEMSEEDLELLYELYGVTDDDKLQTF